MFGQFIIMRFLAGQVLNWGLKTRACPSGLRRGMTTADHRSDGVGPKILVLGGNGFVGSHICEQAVQHGCTVSSLNRSGPPSGYTGSWAASVEWLQGDALQLPEDEYKQHLKGCDAVISCVGAFGSNDFMEKVCGDLTVRAAELAKDTGVGRFVFISAHDMFGSFVPPMLAGYVRGKRKAEAAIFAAFPDAGIALRPGMIYGPPGLVPTIIGAPLDALLSTLRPVTSKLPLVNGLLVPPISGKDVAGAAVNCAINVSVSPGLKDTSTMLALAKEL